MEAEVKFEGVVEVKPFLEVLQFIGGYVSEVYFEIKEDTMIFKFINPMITVTSQIELPFYSVEKKAELAYGLEVARLLDVLPIILEGAETATIKIGSVEEFIVEYGKFRYVSALIDPDAVRKPKVDIHELAKEFEEEGCRVEVDMKTLKEIIKTASHEFLYFDLNDFYFIHNGTKRFEVEGWVCYEAIDNCYRVEYLQPLLSLKSVEKFVMYVLKGKPIVIKNEVWTPYDLITIVAPYIQENVEELKEQFEQKAGELVLSVSEDVFKVYKRSLKAMSVSYLAIKGGVAYFMEGLPDTPSSIVRFEDMETASINVDEAYYEIGRDFKELVKVADSLELYQSDKLYMLGTEVGEKTEPIPIPEVEGHEIELTKDEYKSLVGLSKEKYGQIVVYHRRERMPDIVYLFLANIGTEHVELGPRIELIAPAGLPDIFKVYKFERLAKYGDHATLVVGDKLHILHIKEVKILRRQFEVRWDTMYPDLITKENPNVQEMVLKEIHKALGIEEKPPKVEEKLDIKKKVEEVKKKQVGLTEEELRSILETIKYTLSPEQLKEKVEKFSWEKMTPEQKKIVEEALRKRFEEIEMDRKIQKLYELLKQLIHQVDSIEELEAVEQKVRQSPLTDVMKEDLLRMIEEKKKQIERKPTMVEIQYLYNLFNEFIDICTTPEQLRFVEDKVKISPLPESMKEDILRKIEVIKPPEVRLPVEVRSPVEVKPPEVPVEKELRYLEVQKQLGMKMHPQIEASLKKLEQLGYPKEKIEEIRKWFE